MRVKPYVTTAITLFAVFLALLSILAVLNRRNQTVGLNQEIQYDDFAFSVLRFRKAVALGGSQPESPSGEFTVVTMKISNHARRVNFTFHRDVVVLVDEDGNEYRATERGQKALEAEPTQAPRCESDIPAGAACVTDVVFELPKAARISHLQVVNGGAIGGVLDTIFYGKKVIKVTE